MSNNTPIRWLDPKFICEACQQAAADKAWGYRHSVESMIFVYCETSQSSLTLFSWHGRPLHYTVSNPASHEACMRSFSIQRDASMPDFLSRLESGYLRIDQDGSLNSIFEEHRPRFTTQIIPFPQSQNRSQSRGRDRIL